MNAHPYHAEIHHLVTELAKEFTLDEVDDGGEVFATKTVDEAVDVILSVDDSTLYVQDKDGRSLFVSIFLGNEPGYAVNDHSSRCQALEDIVMDTFDKFETAY